MFSVIRSVGSLQGFQEYDGPLLEPFELYAAKSGSELVNDQLYWFVDRGERKVAIRPEMTPTLARLVAGKIQELPKPIRWLSIPNVWRYERPQKGRLREHWQANVDILGGDPIFADAEILGLLRAVFQKFDVLSGVSIRINNRKLMDYMFSEVFKIPPDSRVAVSRLIDARAKLKPGAFEEGLQKAGINSQTQEAIKQFFEMSLDEVSKKYPCLGTEELSALFRCLESYDPSGVVFVFDPAIMRGLDYYTGTVFEAFDISGENPRALCGGGRYDNLVGLFCNQKLSGVGFGLGDVTLRDFLTTQNKIPSLGSFVDVFVGMHKPEDFGLTFDLSQKIRNSGLRTVNALEPEGFGAQIKAAIKLGARFVVLLGENEVKSGKVLVKELSQNSQQEICIADIEKFFESKKGS